MSVTPTPVPSIADTGTVAIPTWMTTQCQDVPRTVICQYKYKSLENNVL